VLVTTSADLAAAVRNELAQQMAAHVTAPTMRESLTRNGALLVAETLDEAITFANEYAPEHLELVTRNAERLLASVQHAGSVFIGAWAPEAAGDYATGGNHTLPTAGYARGFGPLSLEAFGRKMQAQRLEPAGLERIRSAVETLAHAEGLPGHAASVRIRFKPDAQTGSSVNEEARR
jgi:histidinol dehydrogenase